MPKDKFEDEMNEYDRKAYEYWKKTGRDPMKEAFSMPEELHKTKKTPGKKKTKK